LRLLLQFPPPPPHLLSLPTRRSSDLVSEMDWTNKNVNPHKVVQIGDEVEVMVLDIDEERRRISLGLKQCKPNPWQEFAENYKKGDKVSGQIKSITDFNRKSTRLNSSHVKISYA